MTQPPKKTYYARQCLLKRVATVRVTIPEGLLPTVRALIDNYTTAPLSELEQLKTERALRKRHLRTQQIARYRQRLKERKENAQ